MRAFQLIAALSLAVSTAFSSPIVHTKALEAQATYLNVADETILNFVLGIQMLEESY